MDFYEKKRRVKMDINLWLEKASRKPFSDFAMKYGDLYGFDVGTVEKIFNKFFPDLMIVDDKPCKRTQDE